MHYFDFAICGSQYERVPKLCHRIRKFGKFGQISNLESALASKIIAPCGDCVLEDGLSPAPDDANEYFVNLPRIYIMIVFRSPLILTKAWRA